MTIRTAPKQYHCKRCTYPIKVGTQYRRITELVNGQHRQAKYHCECWEEECKEHKAKEAKK